MATDRNTFLGVATCDLALPLPASDIVIFGAADATPHLKGRTSHAANGPTAIRNALRVYQADLSRWDFDQDGVLLDREQIRVFDCGDLPTSPDAPEENRNVIRTATKKILASGAVPVLLGGDDSVPIPFFEAFEDMGKLTIMQIDAHLDWKDRRDGSAHTFSSTMRRASEMPWIERIVQVGLRGIGGSGLQELSRARNWGSRIFTARDIKRQGVHTVLSAIEENSNCLITIDCDGLDPSVIPGVILPQPGGLSYFDVIDLIAGVASKARIVGLDLVELVPERDVQNIGAICAARIICNAIGCIAKHKML
ncbi:arginase family protein [Bradyrhizobium sp. 21]|uniref:arginase family protein n=1 Tax=Bradyrhizobium sp. 21 TaxID=2782666 RepID=UPI001FF80370|nr:arginase family protein [Bradyrhizobium sp. 21]MCK1386414.1 arginase family protein [Bradyrhizobium sp. 21]